MKTWSRRILGTFSALFWIILSPSAWAPPALPGPPPHGIPVGGLEIAVAGCLLVSLFVMKMKRDR